MFKGKHSKHENIQFKQLPFLFAGKQVLFLHIADVAKAFAAYAGGAAYGTGTALPMFVKMTAAQALGWNGTTKREPLLRADIGFGPALMKSSDPAKKKGMAFLIKAFGSKRDSAIIEETDWVRVLCCARVPSAKRLEARPNRKRNGPNWQ